MSAKLTFEAQMTGLEKVLELLNKTKESTEGLGVSGLHSFEAMDRKMKEFSSSMEYLSKQQSGLGGLNKIFDDISTKSYKIIGETRGKILENYKNEAKQFEEMAKSAEDKIDKLEKRINDIKIKKESERTQSELADISFYERSKSAAQQEQVLAAAEKARKEKEIWKESPFFGPDASKFLAKYGGGLGAQLGAATNAQAFAAMPSLGLMAAGAIQGLGTTAIAAYRSQVYDRSLQPMQEFLGARNLLAMSAEGVTGDPTTAILRKYGIGIEAKEGSSKATEREATISSIMSSREFRGIIGAIIAASGAAITAGTLGMSSGLTVPMIAAGAGMAAGYYTADPQSKEQELNKRRQMYAEMDKKAFGELFGPAAEKFREESRLTERQQRMLGLEESRKNIAELVAQGVASLKDLSDFINELNKLGLTLKEASTAMFPRQYGIQTKAGTDAFIRSIAYSGGEAAAKQQFGNLAGMAGFYSKGTLEARNILYDYAAKGVMDRGAGAVTIEQVGAATALSARALAGPIIPENQLSLEQRLQQNQRQILAAETARDFSKDIEKMEAKGNISDDLKRAALTRLGISNEFVQSALIKADLDNIDTQKRIQRLSNKKLTIEQIQQELSGGRAIQVRAIKQIIGAEGWSQFEKGGFDPFTMVTSGDMKTAENIRKLGQSGAEMYISRGNIPEEYKVPPGQGVQAAPAYVDKESANEAKQQAQLNEALKKTAEKLGTDFTQILTEGIAKALQDSSEKIRKTSEKIFQAPPEPEPFLGTKESWTKAAKELATFGTIKGE